MSGVRSVFVLALLCVVLAALASLFDPLVLRFTLDAVLARKAPELPEPLASALSALGGTSYLAKNLWLCALALLATSAVNALFSFLKGALSAFAAERTIKNLRDRLAAHIDALPASYFSKMSAGDLVQRSTSDMDTVRRLLATQVEDVGRAVSLLVLTVVMMASIDLPMTLVSIPVVPAVFLFSFFFYKKIQKAFLVSDEAEASLTHVLEENLHGIRVVRAFARENFEIERFDEKNRFFTGKTRDLISLFGWYWGVSVLLCAAQESVTIGVGAGRVAVGLLTTGTYMAFIAYVGRLLWPVRQLGRTLTEVSKAMVSLGRITQVLNEADEYARDKVVERRDCPAGAAPGAAGAAAAVATAAGAAPARGRELARRVEGGSPARGEPLPGARVEFDRLTLEYEGGKRVLDELCFTVESGETVAILGRTGSGKSSIAAALVRLVEPSAGSIRLDGVDIRDMDRRRLRTEVGLVLQEPYLFSRSLRENVELGSGLLTEEELERASRLSALDSVVASFDGKWDTAVGEEGVTLSGGQRQRLALARVLARRPRVLVLDDTLSALDTETDAKVRRELAADAAGARRSGGRSATTIIVAHRITTLMSADRIVVLEAGRIADIGSHEELVARPGLYRRVWEIQGRGAESLAAGAGKGGLTPPSSRAMIGE